MVRAIALGALIAGVLLGAPAGAFDPTAPPAPAAATQADGAGAAAQLAWVRVDGLRSVAWYDGTVARLGDTVSGGRLAAIHEDHIVLVGSSGTRRVYLLDPRLRAQPSTTAR